MAREVVHHEPECLPTDVETTPLVTENPTPSTCPREFDQVAGYVLGEGDDARAGASDGGHGVRNVMADSEWRSEEMGVVGDGEVWAQGEAEERCDSDCGVARCRGGVDTGDAEPGGREHAWCDGQGHGIDRGRGDACLECVGDGCVDGVSKVCRGHVGKVGRATESTADNVAIVVGDDGGGLGSTAVYAEEEGHGGSDGTRAVRGSGQETISDRIADHDGPGRACTWTH